MSGRGGDHYSPPSRQRDPYSRRSYVQTCDDTRHQAVSGSLDPLDPLSNAKMPPGYSGRDNGWGNRGSRPKSLVEPLRSVEPDQSATPPTTDPQACLPSRLPSLGGGVPAVAFGTSAKPPTSDPRRNLAPPNHIAEAESPCLVELPPSDLMNSEWVIKLEYALRMIEGRLQKQLAVPEPHWERLDTDLLSKLIKAHRVLGTESTMSLRTMQTAMRHYKVMVDCMAAEQAHDSANTQLDTIRHGVQYIVFDVCEHARSNTRKQGHRALLDLSSCDLTLHQGNLTALVELLQNDDEDERALVREILFMHLDLANRARYPGVDLSICFQLMFRDKPELSGLVLDFFASEWGDRVLEMIVGEPTHEAALAKHLAGMLLLANKFRIPKIITLLHNLQSIWVGPDDVLSEAEKEAARVAAVAVLWKLGWILIARNSLWARPAGRDCTSADKDSPLLSKELTEILVGSDTQTTSRIVTDGLKVFSELIKAVEKTMYNRGEELRIAAAEQLSKARIFLNELEASTAYLWCYLPLEAGAVEEPGRAVHHFSSAQKIVLFRSAAILAARVASAAEQCPSGLAWDGQSFAYDISKVMARALMAHVPTNGVAYVHVGEEACDPTVTAARRAYTLLATEALLTALNQCGSCIPTEKRQAWCNGHFRDRVRYLVGIAREVEERHSYPKEVRDAAKTILRLVKRFDSALPRTDAEQLTPAWLSPSPAMPKWVDPSAEAKSKKRKIQASFEVKPEPGNVRGRGSIHADSEHASDRSWGAIGKIDPSAADRSSHVDKGLTIKGSSQAAERRESRKDRLPEDHRIETDPRPLAERLGGRRSSGSSSSSHRGWKEEPRGSYDDRKRQWEDRDARSWWRHRDEGYHGYDADDSRRGWGR